MNKLYENTTKFITIQLTSREEWLQARENSIGGSEASSLIDVNPYCSLRQLWERKKSNNIEEISNELIDYGNRLEPILRAMFQAKHPDYDVQYQENTLLKSNEFDFAHYSADGLIWDGARPGILEIKTSFIRNSEMSNEWKNRIPTQYFVQILHGLWVTGFDFVDLFAELRYLDGNSSIKQYHIERKEVLDDIEYLIEQETTNWNRYFLGNEEPPITIKLGG